MGAFSLIEVTVALAIFSFAILAIIGLLSQALNVSADTRQDSAMATLIRTLDAEIRSASLSSSATSVNDLVTGSRYFDIVGKQVAATDSNAFYEVSFANSNQSAAERARVESLLSVEDASRLNIWSVTISTPARKTVVLINNLTL